MSDYEDVKNRGLEPRPSHLPKDVSKLAVDLDYKKVFENEDKWDLDGLMAYQRAANYISVAMIFLLNNGTLSRPLTKDDIKPRLLGHFGTCPGLTLVYSHANALIKRRENEGKDLKSIFVTGPGHGAPSVLAGLYLEGAITRFYPQYSIDKTGFERFIKSFSFPGGFPSHINSETPGCIHEGGELGYSLAVSYGSVMDNPDLIAVCVIGDGESESGPLAAALHAHKFIDPAESGAVLPVLHVNGYKISERTIPGTADDLELVTLYSGYGYQVSFVEYGPLASTIEEHTEKDRNVNASLAVSMEWAYEEIRKIQTAARNGKPIDKPRWPLIVLRTPKGYTGPRKVRDTPLEGSFHSHQVPLPKCKTSDEEFKLLEKWLKSYHPDEIFNVNTGNENKLINRNALSIIPTNPESRMGYIKDTYDSHKPLDVPEWLEFAKEKGTNISTMEVAGEIFADVIKRNPKHFRIFCPDELESNKLSKALDVTTRNFQWDPETAHKGGRVIEMLSEHTLQGFMQGYSLTGRTAVFPSYEAFLNIVASMIIQYSKFIKMGLDMDWRGDVSSLTYIATSNLFEQEHNGYSHQSPGIISTFQTLPRHLARIYFPVDANQTLSCIAHCLRSKNYVNLIVGSKRPSQVLLSPEEAKRHCIAGATIWEDYSTDKGINPEIVLVGIGVQPTSEVVAASIMLRNADVRVRVVNIYDLMILAGNKDEHPHALDESAFNSLFTRDKPVIINYHGYSTQVTSLLFQRSHSLNRQRFVIKSFREQGTTVTPYIMLWVNEVSRYHVADIAIKLVAKYNPDAKSVVKAHEKATNWLHEGVNMVKYASEFGKDHQIVEELPKLKV